MSRKQIENNRKITLILEGNLSIYEACALRERVISSLRDAGTLELDLTDIRECDTSGLQILCSAKKTADKKGGRIVITGIPRVVEDAMMKTGITHEMIDHDGGIECQR